MNINFGDRLQNKRRVRRKKRGRKLEKQSRLDQKKIATVPDQRSHPVKWTGQRGLYRTWSRSGIPFTVISLTEMDSTWSWSEVPNTEMDCYTEEELYLVQIRNPIHWDRPDRNGFYLVLTRVPSTEIGWAERTVLYLVQIRNPIHCDRPDRKEFYLVLIRAPIQWDGLDRGGTVPCPDQGSHPLKWTRQWGTLPGPERAVLYLILIRGPIHWDGLYTVQRGLDCTWSWSGAPSTEMDWTERAVLYLVLIRGTFHWDGLDREGCVNCTWSWSGVPSTEMDWTEGAVLYLVLLRSSIHWDGLDREGCTVPGPDQEFHPLRWTGQRGNPRSTTCCWRQPVNKAKSGKGKVQKEEIIPFSKMTRFGEYVKGLF